MWKLNTKRKNAKRRRKTKNIKTRQDFIKKSKTKTKSKTK